MESKTLNRQEVIDVMAEAIFEAEGEAAGVTGNLDALQRVRGIMSVANKLGLKDEVNEEVEQLELES